PDFVCTMWTARSGISFGSFSSGMSSKYGFYVPNLVGITQRRAYKAPALRLERDHMLAPRQHHPTQGAAKAAELRKTQPHLSEAQAFAKVYNDPPTEGLSSASAILPTPPCV